MRTRELTAASGARGTSSENDETRTTGGHDRERATKRHIRHARQMMNYLSAVATVMILLAVWAAVKPARRRYVWPDPRIRLSYQPETMSVRRSGDKESTPKPAIHMTADPCSYRS